MNKLVILESPNKIVKVKKYLDEIDKNNKYIVCASVGHVRQLTGGGDYNTGIDFKMMNPSFIVSQDKIKVVKNIKDLASKCNEIILATDPDREGEVISWHLKEILKDNNNIFRRMKLHSITHDEINKQINKLEEININYVNAGISRMMLDKIVGYILSPIVQQNTGGASCGRVQSAVLLLLLERELDIKTHVESFYYTLQDNNAICLKNINVLENKKIELKKYQTEEEIDNVFKQCSNKYIVKDIKKTEFEDSSYTNFTTSDYLQACKNKLNIKIKEATNIAQSLFEKGLITYIRTDSTKLDPETETKLIDFVSKKYGEPYVAKAIASRKEKETDQEGHPPITPTHLEWEPIEIKKYIDFELSENEKKIYRLIWQNTINSALKPPKGIKFTYILENNNNFFSGDFKDYSFYGYYDIDDDLKKPEKKDISWNINDSVNVQELKKIINVNKAKSRYNEASLVKELEKRGIGRPSTYKNMVEVNMTRNYANIDSKDSIFLTDLGIKVGSFIKENLQEVINLEYTKIMEDKLDEISKNNLNYKEYLKLIVNNILSQTTKKYKNTTTCPKCNKGIVIIKTSKKNTQFEGCSLYPECDYIKFLNNDININYSTCPKCKQKKLKKGIAKNGNKYKKCFNEVCNFIEFKNKK